tara:strand:- start:102 stop:545 length:444 start_codon:yes stop_codon:yes gene_type:complete
MKKLVIIALALVTLNGFAQQKGHRKMDRENTSELRKEMTPSDIADLKAKKLTLKLDLTDAQQKEVHLLILEQAKTRDGLRKEHLAKKGDKKEKPSKDDIVKRQNQKLDEQIKMKRKMKTILNADQYAKFEKMKPRKHKKRSKGKKKE